MENVRSKILLCSVKSLENQAFFLVMYACNRKIEFRTSDFKNIKVGHYWCFWRKKQEEKDTTRPRIC